MKHKYIVIILAVLLHISCKTVSPLAVSDEKQVSPYSKQSQKFPSKIHFANIRYFSIKKTNDVDMYQLNFKSDAELFCETQCSKFDLKKSEQGGFLNFEVIRTPIAGNTTPGGLDSNEDLKLNDSNFKKLVLNNFAKKKHRLVIDTLPKTINQKLEVALAEIYSAIAIGGESSGYQVTIDGKSHTATFKSQDISKQLSAIDLSTPKSVIIIGSQKTAEGIERGIYPVFEIESIEFIQTDD
jgi:hypothetical protein